MARCRNFSATASGNCSRRPLLTDGQETFRLGERVRATAGFNEIWEGSDLAQIVTRFAEAARNRSRHLAKNPEKTEAKIRM